MRRKIKVSRFAAGSTSKEFWTVPLKHTSIIADSHRKSSHKALIQGSTHSNGVGRRKWCAEGATELCVLLRTGAGSNIPASRFSLGALASSYNDLIANTFLGTTHTLSIKAVSYAN